jgi:hypothetical protein
MIQSRNMLAQNKNKMISLVLQSEEKKINNQFLKIETETERQSLKLKC